MKFLTKLALVASIATTLIFIYLFYLESFNYDNYVFATLHFNLKRFAIIPGIFWSSWTFLKFKKSLKLIQLALLITFCFVSIPAAINATGMVAAKSHQILLGQDYTFQKSLYKTFGNDYVFINFIKNYLSTEPTTTMIIPPNKLPWRHTGNPQIMNSLLYPIETTNNTKYGYPYILISSEEDGAAYHLWPDFKVPAKEIIIYNWETGRPDIITGRDWNPDEWQEQKPWGLIIRK